MPLPLPGSVSAFLGDPAPEAFEGDVVGRLLDLARTITGMDLAWLSVVAGGTQIFERFSGEPDRFGLALMDSFVETHDLGIGAYVGVPVPGTGTGPQRMLCCVSRTTMDANGPAALHCVELLAGALGEVLSDSTSDTDRSRRVRDRVGRVLRGGHLLAVFQPIVQLQTARIIGAEALSRFPAEPVRPDHWFADAQSVGLGIALELAAIEAALPALDELPDDVYLSLNASPALILGPDLVDLLRLLPGERIVIELTEHAAIDDYDELIAAIARVRALGARLAIDDVGAGFSSFNHVLRLQPDIVKLDISIVRAIDSDLARRGLARGLLSVAHDIGATVVAEGVETQGELDTLFHLGIDAAQGFFLARPGALPLPENMARPTPRLVGATSAFGGDDDALAFLARTWIEANDLESVTRPLLDALLDRTGLETSYLNIHDAQTGTTEARYVRNSGPIELPEGMVLPWQDTLCKRCRDADINWTADVPNDLPGCELAEAAGVQTFVSVPVLMRDGTEIGTLCAASTQARFVGATTISEFELMARLIADSYQPPATSA